MFIAKIIILVYQLITRRRFEQMTVLEGQNILVTISGRKRRIRVYYLSWLKQKILRTEGVSGLEVCFQFAKRFIRRVACLYMVAE